MPMNKKSACPPEGAPEWMVTYGDLMGLLLTFFILLLSMSQLKHEEQYHQIVKEVQKAFGMTEGAGRTGLETHPNSTLVKMLEFMSFRSSPQPQRSTSTDKGIEGKESRVTRVREGMLFTKGGRITFEPGSAELTDDVKQRILGVADQIKGYNNIIEVRGHAASMELATGSKYKDLWELSFARAKAVMMFLTSNQVGIAPDRIRVIAMSNYAPLVSRVYTAQAQQPNRRVDLFQTEAITDQFQRPDPPGTSGVSPFTPPGDTD